MRTRVLLAAGCLATVAVLGAQAASADPYPRSGVHVVTGTVSAATARTGSTVTFSGAGFAPSSLLRLSVAGTSRGMTTSSATGACSVRLRLTGNGPRVLAASGVEPGGRLRVVSATVTLQGGSVASSRPLADGLPLTGMDNAYPALGAGLALVAAGSGLVLAGRARRRGRPHARLRR